jgi:predicted O-methyltransferase YrrM
MKQTEEMIERLSAEMKALLKAHQEEMTAKMDSFREEIKASIEETKDWQ